MAYGFGGGFAEGLQGGMQTASTMEDSKAKRAMLQQEQSQRLIQDTVAQVDSNLESLAKTIGSIRQDGPEVEKIKSTYHQALTQAIDSLAQIPGGQKAASLLSQKVNTTIQGLKTMSQANKDDLMAKVEGAAGVVGELQNNAVQKNTQLAQANPAAQGTVNAGGFASERLPGADPQVTGAPSVPGGVAPNMPAPGGAAPGAGPAMPGAMAATGPGSMVQPPAGVPPQGDFGHRVRPTLFAGEDQYFRANPNVAGMAAEDGQIILNPYSPDGVNKDAVVKNEAFRLELRKRGISPNFEVTPEQAQAFAGTEYANDPQALKETIAARIYSGDQSAGATTPEQQAWVRNFGVPPQQAQPAMQNVAPPQPQFDEYGLPVESGGSGEGQMIQIGNNQLTPAQFQSVMKMAGFENEGGGADPEIYKTTINKLVDEQGGLESTIEGAKKMQKLAKDGIISGPGSDAKALVIWGKMASGSATQEERDLYNRTDQYKAAGIGLAAARLKAFGSGSAVSDRDVEYALLQVGGKTDLTPEAIAALTGGLIQESLRKMAGNNKTLKQVGGSAGMRVLPMPLSGDASGARPGFIPDGVFAEAKQYLLAKGGNITQEDINAAAEMVKSKMTAGQFEKVNEKFSGAEAGEQKGNAPSTETHKQVIHEGKKYWVPK